MKKLIIRFIHAVHLKVNMNLSVNTQNDLCHISLLIDILDIVANIYYDMVVIGVTYLSSRPIFLLKKR